MATYTWSHGGSPTTEFFALSAASGSGTSTPDFATATATWVGTGNENGGTGTLNFTADGGNPFFAQFTITVQLEDPGIDPLTPIDTISIDFDWAVTNGPMGTGTAKSAFSSTWDGSDDVQGPGSSTGNYARSTDGVTFGTPTFGDLFAVAGIGTGFIGLGFNFTDYYDSGTFSAHDRSLAISNFTISASDGASAPVVTGVSPPHGDAAGGTVVTLTGTGFTGTTLATFNGSTAAFTPSGDTSGTCVSPSHSVGAVTVTVS